MVPLSALSRFLVSLLFSLCLLSGVLCLSFKVGDNSLNFLIKHSVSGVGFCIKVGGRKTNLASVFSCNLRKHLDDQVCVHLHIQNFDVVEVEIILDSFSLAWLLFSVGAIVPPFFVLIDLVGVLAHCFYLKKI